MIVIDCFPLALKEGGTKTYLRSLLKAISISYTNTPLVLLVPDLPSVSLSDIPQAEHITIKKVQMAPPFLYALNIFVYASSYRYLAYIWEHYYLPHTANKLNPDIILHPYQIATNYKSAAQKIVVVHDIFHWKYQERYNLVEKKIYNVFLEGCKTADKIITISETSKQQLIHFSHIDPSRIYVCYEGYNEEYRGEINSDISSIARVYQLPKKYILAFNSGRVHKNTIGAVKVFHKLKERYQDLHLVLIGGDIHTNAEVYNYISQYKLLESTLVIPFVQSVHDFRVIYHLSTLFLFLSTEEGFGLPPLEALASGTLPIISERSSMKELFSFVLPSFQPDDINGIADYANTVIATPHIKDEAITKASILLQKFSWQTILPLYATVLSM